MFVRFKTIFLSKLQAFSPDPFSYNNRMSKFTLALTALRELGFTKLLNLAVYRFGLKSGHFQRLTPIPIPRPVAFSDIITHLFSPPPPTFFEEHRISLRQILSEADAISKGQVKLFGGDPVAMNLSPQPPLLHWTAYEQGHATWGKEDIKEIWEPARFSWAFTLARAYAIQPDETYSQAFWRYFEQFRLANPPYQGPNWTSAQESALRILAFTFCGHIFYQSISSTTERQGALAQAIADHADRIPPTLIYARSQNNNHLLSEAVGLYTAAAVLPTHPHATSWRKLGWKWFNRGIQNQISEEGTYSQHSTNYHRLMLHLTLWMQLLIQQTNAQPLPEATLSRLSAAVQWLWALVDPETGYVPNLGANDGAHILPLTSLSYQDYRPILQASGIVFLKQTILPPGKWDELAYWMNIPLNPASEMLVQPQSVDMPRLDSSNGRAFIHVANFTDRPSHADQLHVDLWFKGLNLAQDPGTFSYNDLPPWQNALASSLVHNTITLNDQDQMTFASRFLWLNWAQASITEQALSNDGRLTALTAVHNGYRRLGWQHQRTLSAPSEDTFIIDDLLVPCRKNPDIIKARLAWLMLDLPWELKLNRLSLTTPDFSLSLTISGAESLALVRAGECLSGDLSPKPSWGWYSPTYGQRIPALHLIAFTTAVVKPFFSSSFKLS